MTTIKKGYRVTVRSWENDADNYATNSVDGLAKEDCQFHVDLLKLVGRYSDHGNLYQPSDNEIEALQKAAIEVYKKHGKEYDEEYVLDGVVCDLFYTYGISNTEYYTRVAEKITVEYIPHDVTFEDVSKEFGV